MPLVSLVIYGQVREDLPYLHHLRNPDNLYNLRFNFPRILINFHRNLILRLLPQDDLSAAEPVTYLVRLTRLFNIVKKKLGRNWLYFAINHDYNIVYYC